MPGSYDENQPPQRRRMLTEQQRAHFLQRNRESMRAARARETLETTKSRRMATREAIRAARTRKTSEKTHLHREAKLRQRDLLALLTNPKDARS